MCCKQAHLLVYFVHFLSTLADDFAALHCAHFVSLPNFGFEMKIQNSGFDIFDSDSKSAKVRLWPSLSKTNHCNKVKSYLLQFDE